MLASVCSAFPQTPFTPSNTATTSGSDWTTTKITPDDALDYPWEITYGPDDFLWITEREGEKIVRVDPTAYTNTPAVMIDLSSKVVYAKQGGLMGMAIHPALYNDITTTTNNYVYVSYTYNDGGLKVRIARLVYDNSTKTLSEDTTLGSDGAIIEGLPGSADHNSGRLIIGPDQKIYYTIGDQGANQFSYSCDPILSQVLPTSPTDYDNYPGKTLRINLDGTIPSDNPTLNGVKSHVYTYGHRNAQGIIFSADGTLFNSEHGAKVDDEINIIKEGKNYGWPEIAGYYDNMAYTYCNWSSLGGGCNAGDFSDHNCPSGADTATEYESYPTANDVPSNFQPPIGTYNSTIATDPSGGWFTWPTVAPSSIDIHEEGNIPGWGRSLLVTSLKRGTIYRAKLSPDGEDVVGDVYEEWHSSNDRYRDLAISPDGLTIYAITDNGGGTSGPSSTEFVGVTNPGMIVKIEYVGTQVTNPPVAVCQDVTVTLDASGTASITVADVNNGSTGGAAGIASLEISNDTFDCSHVGNSNEVILTVTDNDGNESTCTAIITVQPNGSPAPFTAPVLDDVISVCSITVEAPTLINNACVEVTATTTDQVTYDSGESGTITWTFDDGTNTDTATQNVTVNALPVPTNINVTPSSTSADLSWDDVEDVTFNIRYREVGSTIWLYQTSLTNAITLTSLTLSTDYEFQVNSDCGSSQSAFSSLSTFSTTSINYCDAEGASSGSITNVSITGEASTSINNSSSGNATYTDYTSITPVMLRADGSSTYSISVATSYNSSSGVAVWIDFNQDGDFSDSGEKVWDDAGGTTGNSPRTNSFTVPTDALYGTTRMRVASRRWWTPSGPCGTIVESGQPSEVEDYSVSIYSGLLYTGNVWYPYAPSDLTPTDDILVMDGTFTISSDIDVNSIRVNSGASVTVNKENSVMVNGNIINNGEFELNSDSDEFSSLLVEGNVVGNLKYNRFVNSNSNDNDLVAPPVSGESFADFKLNNTNIFNNGTLNLFGPFDKVTGSYLTYSDTESASLQAAKGYRAASSDNQPFTFNGSVTTSSVNVSISHSGPAFQRWNLIGNPYTSYVKLSDFLAENLNEFDAQAAGVYGYDTNEADGSNWTIWNMAYSDMNPNAIITPGQGFFVSSKIGGGNVVFNPSMRANGNADDFIANRSTNSISHGVIRLSTDNKSFNTDIYITDNATAGLDIGYDASHLGGVPSNFAIYTQLVDGNQGENMAIQALSYNDISNDAIIPLGVNALQGEQITISLENSNITSDVYLQDVLLNSFTLLNTSDYVFQTTNNLNGTGRYFLRFGNNSLSVETPNLDDIIIYTDAVNDRIVAKGQLQNNTTFKVFDIQGRTIINRSVDTNTTEYSISTSGFMSGVYMVQVSNGINKLTKKVVIK